MASEGGELGIEGEVARRPRRGSFWLSWFAALSASCLATSISRAQPADSEATARPSLAGALDPAVDIVAYDFGLELFDDRDEIEGEAEITVRWRLSGSLRLVLDLVARDGSGAGMEVLSVRGPTADGDRGSLAFDHRDDRLEIELAAPSAAGQSQTFIVRYRGAPREGLVIADNKHGERTFFGDNWPRWARHWLPTVDHPADKARCGFTIDAPSHYQVVACGRRVEETDLSGQRRRTVWRSEAPMATKVMVMAAARFAVEEVGAVDGVPVSTWVFPQEREAGFRDFAAAEKVLRFFVDRLGPYPYAKLANVQSRTRYGGTENASNIFYNENSVRGDGSNEGLIAHEIAHQWFGNSVTEADWSHLWLSEGFATYLTQLYLEHAHGRDALVEGMTAARERVLAFGDRQPTLSVVVDRVDDPHAFLSPFTYQKGAWVLHMLRRRVGDSVFWDSLAAFYRRHRDQNATSGDLAAVFEELSGQSLDHFFRQWLERSGHPVIEADWSYLDEAQEIEIELRQMQSEAPFEIPVEIAVAVAAEDGDGGSGSGAGRERLRLIWLPEPILLAERVTSVRLPFDEIPLDLVLDPDVWLLARLGAAKSTSE